MPWEGLHGRLSPVIYMECCRMQLKPKGSQEELAHQQVLQLGKKRYIRACKLCMHLAFRMQSSCIDIVERSSIPKKAEAACTSAAVPAIELSVLTNDC